MIGRPHFFFAFGGCRITSDIRPLLPFDFVRCHRILPGFSEGVVDKTATGRINHCTTNSTVASLGVFLPTTSIFFKQKLPYHLAPFYLCKGDCNKREEPKASLVLLLRIFIFRLSNWPSSVVAFFLSSQQL